MAATRLIARFVRTADPARTTPGTGRTRRSAAALGACALAASLALPLAGCSDSPAALPACHAPEAAVLPHTAGSLTQTDTGIYCLGIGQSLDVFLTAKSPAARWGQITIGDTTILGYGNSGVMTPPMLVTPGVIVGVARGATTVTSDLPGGQTWTATIVVS